MTDKQKKIAEVNHNLIYDYANRNGLDINEYYDILAIGLCKAAIAYNPLVNEKFSPLANRCMKNEMIDYYKSIQKKDCIPANNIVYYDASVKDNDGVRIDNILHSNCNLDDNFISNEIFDEMLNLLTEKEKDVVTLILQGLKKLEIAKKMQCEPANITYYIKTIKRKLKAYV